MLVSRIHLQCFALCKRVPRTDFHMKVVPFCNFDEYTCNSLFDAAFYRKGKLGVVIKSLKKIENRLRLGNSKIRCHCMTINILSWQWSRCSIHTWSSQNEMNAIGPYTDYNGTGNKIIVELKIKYFFYVHQRLPGISLKDCSKIILNLCWWGLLCCDNPAATYQCIIPRSLLGTVIIA